MGPRNRARVLFAAIDECPRTANRLVETIDVDYYTVRYHLEKLKAHNVMECG